MKKESIHHRPGKLFIVCAPSGGGKTTVSTNAIRRLQGEFPISKVVTYTSRPPRTNEVNGTDYFFITQQDFQDKNKANFFLETTEYDGNFYGSPASLIADLASGKSFILVTDRAGARFYLQKFPDAVSIWLVSSIDALRQRLSRRNGKSVEQTERRVALAAKELEDEQQEKLFRHHVINDLFEKTVQDVMAIIRDALTLQ